MEKRMKEIVIKSCNECQHSKLYDPGKNAWFFCELEQKRIGNFKEISLKRHDSIIPEWCRLDDYLTEARWIIGEKE